MRLLLDTHIAYWLALDPERLTSNERRLLNSAGEAPAYSAVSIWEMRIKWASLHTSGARKGPASPETVLAAFQLAGFEQLPLTAEDAAADLTFALAHKDPFDELLLVHAQQHRRQLLTRDRKLIGHPLAMAG